MDLIDMTIVAQAMAHYYGVSVEMKREYDTAITRYTNPEYGVGRYTIQLPMIGGLSDKDATILRGYLDHEVGHVKFTDFESLVPAYEEWKAENISERRNSLHVWKQCFNIVEDVRIERLMMKRYPGSVYNLRVLNRRFITAATFSKALRDMSDSLRRTSHCSRYSAVFMQLVLTLAKGMLHNGDKEHDAICAEAMFLVRHEDVVTAEKLAAAAVAAETEDDVYRVVMDMMDVISDKINEAAREDWAKSGETDDDENDDSGVEEDFSDDGARTLLDRFSSAQWSTSSVEIGDCMLDNPVDMGERAFDIMKEKGMESSSKELMKTVDTASDGSVDNLTIAAEIMAELRYRDAANSVYSRRGLSGNRQLLMDKESRGEIRLLAARMYNVFVSSLETVTYVRSRSRAWGTRPDMAHLYRPSCMDGRVFRTNAIRQALDTNVSVLLDMSGSMDCTADFAGRSRAQLATIASQSMVGALRKLPHVDAVLYAFKGELFQELGEDRCIRPEGGTPTALALMDTQLAMSRRAVRARNIIFIVTDGEPDHRRAMEGMMCKLRKQGVEIVGIEICNRGVMENAVGKDSYVYCEDLKSLPDALMRTMRKCMWRHHV